MGLYKHTNNWKEDDVVRKVPALWLTTLAISLFASMGFIAPASATEPRYFVLAPMFDDGSWTTGWILALELPGFTPFVPLMGARFEAYQYFETVQEEEPQRVCHYKVLIACLDEEGTLEFCWKTEWDLDPVDNEDATGIVTGVLKRGTGALAGFHGVTYAKLNAQMEPIDSWATYHFDP